MKTLNLAMGLLLSLATSFTQAIPLTTNAPSGQAGDTVNVLLSEPTPAGLNAITLNFSYDASILTYISGAIGDVDPLALEFGLDPFFVDPVLGGVVSIAYPATVTTGGSLLDLVFRINSGAAPGTTTTVDFSCFDYGGGLGCFDYPFDPVQATVTVLQPASTPMPLPGTLPLMGLGCAALLWARRRRH